jgi:hypothetical protein
MAGSPVLTASFPALLKLTLDETFTDASGGEVFWPKLFKESTASEAYIDDQEIAGLGLMPERLEGSVMSAADAPKQGYSTRYTLRFFGGRVLVTEQMKVFNQYEKAINLTAMQGDSAKKTQETEAASVFSRAFDSGYVGGDGLELCSTAHLLSKGGTYSNELATPASLTELSLETMYTQARKIVGPNGLRQGLRVTKLIIPSDLEFKAERILKSAQQNDTANNAINAIKSKGISIVDDPFFTSTTNWWVGTDAKVGLRWIWAKRPTFKETSVANAETTEFTASQWFTCGWTDPRCVIGSAI